MIEYRNVSREYPGGNGSADVVRAVRDVTLRVETGEFCVLLGPSGCGKTTLLRMANRLTEPTSGTILIDGKNIAEENPVALRRRIGYVIQGVGLFPHRTVARNIGTTLELLGTDKRKIDRRADELLEMVRLDPARYRNRYPSQLSGGEAQRVGIARALAADPPLLLMDEPFGALDPITRADIRREFLSLQRELRKTILLVTHDVSEGMLFGDSVALMRAGSLVAHASPYELLRNPADEFVRDFFGAEAELLLLDAYRAQDILERTEPDRELPKQEVAPDTSLKKALGIMMGTGERALRVVDAEDRTLGVVTMERLLERMKADSAIRETATRGTEAGNG